MSPLRRLRAVFATRERIDGEPRSANGASSFHLVWELPATPLLEVSATLEVLQPPMVGRLYFFALQVSFATERTLCGGAHLGLQWNPRFPGSTAANWGGYAPAESGGGLLAGAPSPLPSARNDPNTRDFPWKVGRRYRLRVAPSPDASPDVHAWRGTITDLETGNETVVRDLHTHGAYLTAPIVWTEAFARCEHPAVAVRWSDLRTVNSAGAEVRPARVRVNYQGRGEGGCDNTTVVVDELGLVQATATQRQIPHGAVVMVPSQGKRLQAP
ncbi:MAG: hypothetical protein A2Z12_10065 [Actinobacteria bacterium RBG_16_68_21]|nr:MAG: hypothetical protein A2Z12_10065 [Actinobacteria bacterium RBG_16_68_21]